MNVRKKELPCWLGNPLQFCSGVTGICHAHYGGISSDGVLYCLGGSLHSLCGIGSEADQPSDKRAQKAAFDLCNGRSLCLCAVCPEISKCDRILQPPNGNRSGSHSLWPDSHAVIGFLVLIFQALLLAHGGLTTLGANTFSMAIAGPVVSWGVYKLGRKIKLNQKVAVFLAAALGNLFTYCVTSVQLGLAHPAADGVWSAVVRFWEFLH